MQSPDTLEDGEEDGKQDGQADVKEEMSGQPSVLRQGVLILWPSFLAACLIEALVFSLVDPGEIHWSGQVPQPSRQTVYSVAFFMFWLIAAACNALVLWLSRSERRVNAETLSGKSES
jgi:hypothetical protein